MPEIKAIIFDMDGVLIDAKEWHYEALNRALGLFGHRISRYDHLVTYDGLPTKRKLEMLSVERGLPRALHQFVHELKQRYTLELAQAGCRPVFQREYALSALRANGYRIGVASNSVRRTIDLLMQKSNLCQYLDVIVSNEDVTLPKPDPGMYLKAMASLDCDPTECLVVEDNPHGIRAAEASGAHVMIVQGVEDVTYERVVRRIEECARGIA